MSSLREIGLNRGMNQSNQTIDLTGLASQRLKYPLCSQGCERRLKCHNQDAKKFVATVILVFDFELLVDDC